VVAADLRALVKTPLLLTGVAAVPSGRGHQISPAIKAGRDYPVGSRRLALPKTGPGVERLQLAIATAIPEIGENYARESWEKLLDTPTLIIEVTPTRAVLEAAGIAAGSPNAERFHSVVIGAVFRRTDESFDGGELTAVRSGAVGTLNLLRMDGSPRATEDAWLTTAWVDSTRAMLVELERIENLALPPLGQSHPRVDVALGPALWGAAPQLKEQIERIARLVGVRTTVHRVSDSSIKHVLQSLRTSIPGHLILAGEGIPQEVGAAFTKEASTSRLLMMLPATPEELLQLLRETLARYAGVSPALTPVRADELVTAPIRLPITAASNCLHVGNRVYVQESGSERWWTRDDYNHGGSAFKTYEKQHMTLHWIADHDVSGKIFDGKHKGSSGREVSIVNARGCANTASHL
jgi:hypothetical protein